MLSLVLASALALAVDAGPPGVPWPTEPPPEVRAPVRIVPLDLARYERHMDAARLGIGVYLAGVAATVAGVYFILDYRGSVALPLVLGGAAGMLAGPALVVGYGWSATHMLQGAGIRVPYAAGIVAMIGLTTGAWPMAVVAGWMQLQANERALERSRRLSLVPSVLPGGGALSLVVRL